MSTEVASSTLPEVLLAFAERCPRNARLAMFALAAAVFAVAAAVNGLERASLLIAATSVLSFVAWIELVQRSAMAHTPSQRRLLGGARWTLAAIASVTGFAVFIGLFLNILGRWIS